MKTVIIIAGPTAVGKTARAIELAKYFNTVILSADSRQCYKELNIGVARPSIAELQAVPHFFIASHSVTEELNAAWYEGYALSLIQKIFETKEVIIVCGGTGLYIKALVEGMDAIPEVDASVRREIIATYNENGIEWLQEELKAKDPLFASKGEMQNPHRMMRALEVVVSSGKSILRYHKKNKTQRPFRILQVGLELDRALLYDNINHRVDLMVEEGLEEEVKRMVPFQHLNALQTVGYRELFDFFSGKITRDRAIELIKQNTRHYAKRQMTWFKKNKDIHWIDVQQIKTIVPIVESLLKQTF